MKSNSESEKNNTKDQQTNDNSIDKVDSISKYLNMFPSLASNMTARIKNSSALNPLLWIIGIVSISAFSAACITKSEFLSYAFFILGSLPILYALYAYHHLMTKNPDYLRSEEFHIKKMASEMIGTKGKQFFPMAGHIVDIASPNPIQEEREIKKRLPKGKSK